MSLARFGNIRKVYVASGCFCAYKNTSPMWEQSTALDRAIDKTCNIIVGGIVGSGIGFCIGLFSPLVMVVMVVMVVMAGQKISSIIKN